ncbi:MAG: selenocysteine-specific translation elongation factor [Geodermatophilaceae bacterium]
MFVVATAGHVDHGKSTLVRLLTGMEPDRWAEERRRGMTIDLGFAWTGLPTGETVAFVDVPGHERFVANMLAGVGPVPAVMFVVAADEGWKAQSAEHLGALDALGVRHGLLVVTRSDLADPAAAQAQAQAEIAATTLGSVPAVCVSGRTGKGLDDLRLALHLLVAALAPSSVDSDVRLWVDRAFTIKGAGTVVTGTLPAGQLHVGQELVVAGSGQRVVLRGLQSLGETVPHVTATARVAANLRGVALDDVRRGDALLTPQRWLTTSLLDVRLRGDSAADLPGELALHIGSAAVTARVRPLGADTARLSLNRALPLRVGDVAVLRDPGRRKIAAGATILDIRPPALRRRGAGAVRAAVLSDMDGTPDGLAEVRRRGIIKAGDLRAMGATPPGAPVAGDWLVDDTLRADLGAHLVAATTRYAAAHPLEQGAPVEVLRRELRLPDVRLVAALVRPPLALHEGRVLPADTGPALPADVQRAVDAVRQDLTVAPYAAPDANRLAELGLRAKQLGAAVRVGALLKVADGVFLLPGADESAAGLLAGLPQPFTLSEARQALGTSRRVAVPLLELLERQGRTVRLADSRHTVAPRLT